MATGLLFGLAPLMHTRASGLLAALKDGGRKGRPPARRGITSAAALVDGRGRARGDAGDRRRPAAAHGLAISRRSMPASIARGS